MSAIAGFFQLDGSPAEPKLLEKMLARMAARGPDGSGMHVEGPIALGHLALHITPESIAERQPTAFPRLGLVISADARLDNRDELLDALEVSGVARNMPDPEIIVGAYEKWGADCPAKLLGDFVFVIWDQRKRELFCARDQLGARQLYYHLSSQRFVFASEIKSVLVVPGVPRRIDELKLACRLGRVPACRERTLYEGIVQLLPASTLTLGPSIAPRFRRYWEPVMEPELRLASSRDYAEALRELVFAAVRARLRCVYPVAATLSGGLDSSAVACIAARELALRGQELLAVSNLVNRGSHPVPESDERHFVQSVVDQEPNIKIEWALGTQFLPINFDEKYLDRFDEPPDDPFFFRTRELCQIASSRNARILLFGMGGDMAASSNGSGWLEQLARKGRLLELTRQLSAQARIRGVNTKSILKTEVLRPLSPQWLRNLHDRRRLGPRPLWWGTVINPDFAARMRLDVLWNELGLATDPPQDVRLLVKPYLDRGLDAHFAGGYSPTMQALHPLFDRRIWEFCYRVPLEQFVLDGMPRSLFRRAMSEVLPAPIRNRTSKGWFAPDFSVRLVDQKKQASDFLKHYGNNLVWQYVHRPPIEKWLRRTETGWTDGHSDIETQFHKQRGIAIGLKMAHFLLRLTGA